MAWNPTPSLGPTSWSGNPQVALASQLVSTTSTLLFGIQSSINYTTLTSNSLQGQINNLAVSTGTASSWYLFPALSTVNFQNNYIVSTNVVANSINASSLTVSNGIAGNLTGNVTGSVTGSVNGPVSGNVTGNVTGNLNGNVVGNISNADLYVQGSNSINIINDKGASLIGFRSIVNIAAQYGQGSQINIDAKAASIYSTTPTAQVNITAAGNSAAGTFAPIGGKVTITANNGSGTGSGILGYGEIDLTAYSQGVYAGVIKLSAGANMIYAGPASPYFGLYGQNTIYGQTANSMIAGAVPTLPTLIGTNYFYGALGTLGPTYQIVGNRMQGGFGVDFIQPYPNGDLYIQSNANGTDTIIMRGIKSIEMSNAGNITNVGNIGLNMINGAAYPPTGTQTFTGVSTNTLSTGSAFVSSINGYSFGSLVPNTQYVSSILTSSGTVVSGTESTQQLLVSSINGGNLTQPYISTLSISSGTVASDTISTQNLLVSSINGAPVVPQYLSSLSLSTGTVKASRIDVGTAYVSTLYVSTSYIQNTIDIFASTLSLVVDAIYASTIQISRGGIQFVSTGAAYDLTHNFTSTATNFANIANVTNKIFNYTMTSITTATPPSFDMGWWFDVTVDNQSLWLQKQINYTGVLAPGNQPTVNIISGGITIGSYFDLNNSASNGSVIYVWNPKISGGALTSVSPGVSLRFTYTGTTWTFVTTPTQTGQTATNSFTVQQGFTTTVMSTNNQLIINSGETIFNNQITVPYAYVDTLYSAIQFNSTIVGNTVSTQALTLSSINGTALTSLINPDQSYFSSITVSTQKLTASSITGLLQYNVTSTIANVADILSVNNKILTANMVLTSPVPILGMTFNFVFNDANYEYWNNTGFSPDASYTSQIQNLQTLVTHSTGQVDFYFGFSRTVQINYPGGSTLIGDFSSGYPGQARFTFAAGVWTFTNTFTGGNVVNTNSLLITQNIGQTVIQTSDAIVVSTSAFLTNSDMYLGKVTAQTLNVSSISTGTLTIGGLNLPGNITTAGNLQTGGYISTGTNLYVGNSAYIGSNVISLSSITNAVYTSNTDSNINQYNVKNFTTTAYYNSRLSTFGTSSGGSITSLTVYGNSAKFNAYPGLSNVGIANGLPGGQYYYLKADGTTKIGTTFPGTNPASPNPWWSSIITVYNNVAGDYLVFDWNGGNGECYIQTMGTSNLNYQVIGGASGTSYIAPTTVPSYYRLGWNVLSNAILFPVSAPYTPALQNQLTSLDVGFNNNINLTASTVTFANKQVEMFQQTFDGYLVRGNNGLYSKADAGGTITNPSGKTYPISDWACICSLAGINVYGQFNLALNEQLVTTGNDGAGNWLAHCYCTTATIAGATNPHVYWNIAVTMVPRIIGTPVSFQTASNLGDEPPPIPQELPWLVLSSIAASTFTVQTTENISVNANVSTPTFLGNGNVAINANVNIDMMANYDMNIDAGDAIFIQGNSTINLTSYNPAQPATFLVINDGDPFFSVGTTISLQNISTYDWGYLYLADGLGTIYYNAAITIAPGGLYTFTLTNAIPNGNYLQVAVGDVGGNSINEILINASGVVSYYVLGGAGPSPVSVGTGTAAQPETGQINMTASTIYLQNYVDISGALCAPQLLCVSSINGMPYGGGGGGWVGTATSDLNMSSFKIYGSNAGNALGNFQPFKFVYEPPTAAGQSAEFAIQAHPQDAGVVFNLRYGVDLAGGYGYLLCEWPGYIVVPMKIYGQDIALEGGETVHINANSGDVTLHATGVVKVDAPYLDMNGNAIIQSGTANALVFGSSFSRLTSDNNLAVQSLGGYVELNATSGAGTIYLSGSDIEVRGTLTMNGNAIQDSGVVTLKCNGGVKIVDTGTGGAGTLTIDAANHLYWNGTFIA